MNERSVTAAYVMGIRDEREVLTRGVADGEELLGLARSMLTNIEATLHMGFSGEMAEYMRGGRDFWRNQLKKAGNNGK